MTGILAITRAVVIHDELDDVFLRRNLASNAETAKRLSAGLKRTVPLLKIARTKSSDPLCFLSSVHISLSFETDYSAPARDTVSIPAAIELNRAYFHTLQIMKARLRNTIQKIATFESISIAISITTFP